MSETRAPLRLPWQPIETAPKNGTLVLLWLDTEVWPSVALACWQDEKDFPGGGAWYETTSDSGWPIDVEATHWLIPDPPGLC